MVVLDRGGRGVLEGKAMAFDSARVGLEFWDPSSLRETERRGC